MFPPIRLKQHNLSPYADRSMILPRLNKKKIHTRSYQLDNTSLNNSVESTILILPVEDRYSEAKVQQEQTKTDLKDSIQNVMEKASMMRNLSAPKVFRKFYYHLGKGNNHKLIRRLLTERQGWFESTKFTLQLVDFRWQQNTLGINFDRLAYTFNHLEFHREITTKSGLIRNLQLYNPNAFEITPITYVINLETQNNPEFQWFINFFLNNNLYAAKKQYITVPEAKIYYSCTNNHKEEKNKTIVPVKLQPPLLGDKYLWLLKPTNLNRGNGILIFNSLEKLEQLLIQYYKGFHKNGTFIRCRQFVLQKYIERPLLIQGRKFDIRVWGLVTHQSTGHIFKEGYIRTSSETYDIDSDDMFVHLTNNAIQKQSKNYGSFEQGNQISFQELDSFLDGGFSNIFRDMKRQMQIVFNSVRAKLNKFHRRNCFEIFGFDYMVDLNFKVWLIEVNTNPCLEESSPLLQRLLPRMLDDTFKLTIDKIFPCGTKMQVHPVEGYSDTEQMWEQIS